MRTSLAALALLALLVACNAGDDDDDGSSPTPTPGPGTWTALSSLPTAIQEIAVVSLNDEVYVIGGFTGTGAIVPDVHVLGSAGWRTAASLPIAMHHANATVANGKIYVVGFLTGTNFAENGRVFEYDPAGNAWTEKAPMPNGTERGAAAIASSGARIYLAGGLRDGLSVADFWVWDLAAGTAGTWTMLPDLPEARNHLGGAVIGGRFYAVGGRGGGISAHTARLDVFDPGAGAWSSGPAMPTSRAGFASAVLGSNLYVFGGEGNGAVTTGVFAESERFLPASNTWETLASMRTPRHGMGAAASGGAIVVPGGADVQAFGAVNVVESFTPAD